MERGDCILIHFKFDFILTHLLPESQPNYPTEHQQSTGLQFSDPISGHSTKFQDSSFQMQVFEASCHRSDGWSHLEEGVVSSAQKAVSQMASSERSFMYSRESVGPG